MSDPAPLDPKRLEAAIDAVYAGPHDIDSPADFARAAIRAWEASAPKPQPAAGGVSEAMAELIAAARAVHDEHWNEEDQKWYYLQLSPTNDARPKYLRLHHALSALAALAANASGTKGERC